MTTTLNVQIRWVPTALLSAAALLMACATAEAIDCGKAVSSVEKAICSSILGRAQDASLGRLYFATLKRLSGPRHATLIEDQRNWLEDRSSSCSRAESVSKCVGEMTAARIAQIVACYEGGTPDPSAGSMSCAVSVHAACPRSKVSASAAVWYYPFLVAQIDDMVARRKKDDAGADLCVPESKDHPGTPDQNDENFTMTIEGSGENWVAVRSVEDDDVRGGAHPQHWENVATYEAKSGEVFPITKLMPQLKNNETAAQALWDAANAAVSKPCCDDDKPELDDSIEHGGGDDAAGHPLPTAWSIETDGGLKVFYPFTALGRTFVATAVVKRPVFIRWVEPKYVSLFAPPH